MPASSYAAVDLGASSGRVIVGTVADRRVKLREVHRFPNVPVTVRGTLHWDILRVYRGVVDGLRAAARSGPPLDGIGVDAWAVDYGLLDSDDGLIGNPVHYRDSRTEKTMRAVHRELGAERIFARTGIQMQPFNTLYQLKAAEGTAAMRHARTLLLIPDLMSFWLTGRKAAEQTNASTTQLFDPTTDSWDPALAEYLGLRAGLLPELVTPGTPLGSLLPGVADHTGLAESTIAYAVASHDTASAVAAVPARDDDHAYISCGTWSLVGLSLPKPILTTAAEQANFTNERGIDGTTRFLRNVMGLWLLQESLRVWSRAGSGEAPASQLPSLLREAAGQPAFRSVIDPDDPRFLAPGDVPQRIAQLCAETGQPIPATPAAVTRAILDSLALAYDEALQTAQELSGHAVKAVHLVGGGARNELLCQLAADVCGLPVYAGPVEAAALGNVLMQARGAGTAPQEPADLRVLARSSSRPRLHRPVRNQPGVGEARRRFGEARAHTAARAQMHRE